MTGSKETTRPKGTIGHAPLRREDARLVTGVGSFTDDVRLPDVKYVTFVRSTVARGTLDSLDLDDALQSEGVVAAFGGEDVAMLGNLSVATPLEHIAPPKFPILARNTISAVGQPVAALVSRTRQSGLDGVELVSFDVEDEDVVDFPTRSEAPAAAQSWSAGDVKAAFANAAHIVEAKIEHPRLAPCALEPRAIVVQHDGERDITTIWLSTQTPHRARTELAAILGIDELKLRVIAGDVGGAFGMKASLYPEEVFTVWAARKLGCTLRWTATRSEEFLSATHGRGAISSGQLALDKAGAFLGLKADITCPLGHWMTTSAAIPAWNAARILPGPYDIQHVEILTKAELTNTAPVGIYRGAGRPEAAMLMERLVDEAAIATGISRTDLRARNLLSSNQMPHTGPTGRLLDSGDYLEALNTLLASAAYTALSARRDELRSQGGYAGIGFAFFVEPSGRGWESARLEMASDGDIKVATGSSTQGQGRETAYAQIAADVFSLDSDRISVLSGDTQTCPKGIGALASRSTPIGGSAVLKAARELKEKVQNAAPETFPVSVEVIYETEGEAWGYGCHVALVSIDPHTGTLRTEQIVCVDDAGTIINPQLAEGQLVGAIAQGVGEAVMEKIVYDDYGQLVTGSLNDYALPRASDMPQIHTQALHTPSPFNPLGAKGIGEAGTIGAPVAIFNAAHDALAPLGVKHLSMPLTSESLWRAINAPQ